MTSQSNVDPQSLFNEQADNKGKSGNAKADKRHLPETLFKIQVLGDRNIRFFVKCCGVNNKEAYLDWIKNEKSS